ncbi:MAG: tyrosine-protein phosphatase [Pyrinomonadaceae bacterium]
MRKIFTTFIALFAGATFASAQADSTTTASMAHAGSTASVVASDYTLPTAPKAFPTIHIANFGQMDERLYRGAQPSQEDYKALKELGINTVIDLRKDNEPFAKSTVESLGMKYVNIPMTGWNTKDESVTEFLKVADDPSNGKIYLHCAAGMHRTGLAGAIYRLENYGWDYDTAYKEMKNFGYFSGLFHRKIKAYVQDYYKEFGPVKQAAYKAAHAAKTAAAAGTVSLVTAN